MGQDSERPDLVAFLTARLDEEDAIAEEVESARSEWDIDVSPNNNSWLRNGYGDVECDPARVRRDVAARRAILATYETWCKPISDSLGVHQVRTDTYAVATRQELHAVLTILAQPYYDRPDFNRDWRLGYEGA